MTAEQLVAEGRPAEALKALEEEVRRKVDDPELRFFLFQLLSVLGQWDRAATQLEIMADLNDQSLPNAETYGTLIRGERQRAEVFSGKRQPVFMGEPTEWMAGLVRANQLDAGGNSAEATHIRNSALDRAPAVAGSVNGKPLQWVRDGDDRLSQMLEVFVEAQYFWVPFQNIHRILMGAPSHLCDLVWAPARFTWANGAEGVGFIPVRYPGSEASTDSEILMARKTDWTEKPGGLFTGLGQRTLFTDQGEHPLLEVRDLDIGVKGARPEKAAPDVNVTGPAAEA